MKNRTFNIVLAILLVAFLSSCKEESKIESDISPEEMAAASSDLNDWFQKQWEIDVALSPMTQTYLGDKTDYDKWDDISKQEEENQHDRNKARLVYLKDSVNQKTLNEAMPDCNF